jgi:hypothetical protein
MVIIRIYYRTASLDIDNVHVNYRNKLTSGFFIALLVFSIIRRSKFSLKHDMSVTICLNGLCSTYKITKIHLC